MSPGTGLVAYPAFTPDVPQQRKVLGGELPKGFDLPAMHKGYQVEVIQLQRERDMEDSDSWAIPDQTRTVSLQPVAGSQISSQLYRHIDQSTLFYPKMGTRGFTPSKNLPISTSQSHQFYKYLFSRAKEYNSTIEQLFGTSPQHLLNSTFNKAQGWDI